MSPYATEAAKRNLQEGQKKMESTMSTAARVRRDFRMGRAAKPVSNVDPLHRAVAWGRAMTALDSFRGRMTAAGLEPAHVAAAIVYVEVSDPESAHVLLMEAADRATEESRMAAYEVLGRDDVLVIGLLFTQYDAETKQQAVFPFQFAPLNERGLALLRKAATEQHEAWAFLKTQH